MLVKEKLNNTLTEIKLLSLKYFNGCKCDWCDINRKLVNSNKLNELLEHTIKNEQYEISNNILNELNKRKNIVFDDSYRNDLNKRKKETYNKSRKIK